MGSELRHVNIVPIYEVNGDPRAPYMVMEFVEGQTLREMIKIRKKLDVKTSLRIISDVVSALAYASEKGITHRDLKLSNVLISSSGRAKLVDFGLAAAARTTTRISRIAPTRGLSITPPWSGERVFGKMMCGAISSSWDVSCTTSCRGMLPCRTRRIDFKG
jgi:serine/threonine protein kinase